MLLESYPHFIFQYLRSSPGSDPDSSFLVMYVFREGLRNTAGDGSSTLVLGSAWPSHRFAGIEKWTNQQKRDLSLTLSLSLLFSPYCLSTSQVDKKNKPKRILRKKKNAFWLTASKTRVGLQSNKNYILPINLHEFRSYVLEKTIAWFQLKENLNTNLAHAY